MDLEQIKKHLDDCLANCFHHLTRRAEVLWLIYALEAKQTELSAWFEVFGTQQLTHAQASLEALEKRVAEQQAIITRLMELNP